MRDDAIGSFSALVSTIRTNTACVLEAKDAEGRDVMVVCHVMSEDDGTMGVIPIAVLLDDSDVANLEILGRVAYRPAERIQMLITSHNEPKN